jgi:hypothetical protein
MTRVFLMRLKECFVHKKEYKIRNLLRMSDSDVERALREQLASVRAQQQAIVEQYSADFAALSVQDADLSETIQRKEAQLLRLEAEVQQLERGDIRDGAEATSSCSSSKGLRQSLTSVGKSEAQQSPVASPASTASAATGAKAAAAAGAPLVKPQGLAHHIGQAVVEFDEQRSKVR